MAYNPPLRATAYEFYVSLVSAANTHEFQANPTLAAGDVKVYKDGGGAANIATLPTVLASGKVVKVNLSSSEMTADNVTILFSDQTASEEWCDLIINIQPLTWVPANVTYWNGTAIPGVDTAGYPKVTIKSGTGAGEVSLSGGKTLLQDGAVTAAVIATNAIDADALAGDAGAELADAIWDEVLSGHTTAGTAGKALGDAGSGGTPPTAASIADAVWDEALSGHLTAGTAGKALDDAKDGDYIGGSSAAAVAAGKAFQGIVAGTFVTGTLTATSATTNLTGYGNDTFNGRTLTIISGARAGEQATISDHVETAGVLTFAALTGAPANGDEFYIA